MIPEPTVFVLGAGASNPYGFPLGDTLVTDIHGLSKSEVFLNEIRELFPGERVSQIREMAERILDSGFTVDRWLAQNRGYFDAARYCVARAISPLENPEVLRGSWYDDLWEQLLPAEHGEVKPEILLKNNVTFIVFNYDRSLEQGLMRRAVAFFGEKKRLECESALSQFRFIHVHGQIGRLPWQNAVHLQTLEERPYSPKFKPENLFNCLGIRVVTETTSDTKEYIEAKEYLSKAKRIHFLGFGYDDENLSRLKFGTGTPDGCVITGTHYSLSSGRKDQLERDGSAFGMPIKLSNMPPKIIEYAREIF